MTIGKSQKGLRFFQTNIKANYLKKKLSLKSNKKNKSFLNK